jgi:hypothetical protein
MARPGIVNVDARRLGTLAEQLPDVMRITLEERHRCGQSGPRIAHRHSILK